MTVSLPGGQRDYKSFPTLEQANAHKAAWTARKAASGRGRAIAPQVANRLTFGEHFEQWLTTAKLASGTRDMYASHYKNHIGPVLGAMPLRDINTRTLEVLATELASKDLAEGTQARIVSIVGRALSVAIRDGALEGMHPIKRMTNRPTEPDTDERAVTMDELDQLLAASAEPWRSVWLVMFDTAMRWSEMTGLDVGAVDLDQRTVRIRQQNYRGELKETKGKRNRTVGLSERAAKALAPLVQGRGATEPVFTGARGARLQDGNVRNREWDPMMAQLQLADPQPTFHSLRHGGLTYLARFESPAVLQAIAGHESIRTTERYFHIQGRDVRAAASRFDR